jgi:hypothetical protein
MNQEHYGGKKVLSIGAGKKVLNRLTQALDEAGFIATFSYTYDQPELIFRDFAGTHFDVVALGRGVSYENKLNIKTTFKAQNPAIAFVEGLAPVIPLLVDQVKLACLPSTLSPAQVQLLPGKLHIGIPFPCHLQVKLYHLNWLYMSYKKVLADSYSKAGVLNIPLLRRSGFLSIAQDGIIVNVIEITHSRG